MKMKNFWGLKKLGNQSEFANKITEGGSCPSPPAALYGSGGAFTIADSKGGEGFENTLSFPHLFRHSREGGNLVNHCNYVFCLYFYF